MALTQVNGGMLDSVAQQAGFRNRIINGAMVIDQRNAGASVTPTASAYTLDRWRAALSVSSKFSVQQNAGSITPPTGFTNYLGVTSLSAYTVGSGEQFGLSQRVEGFNAADLNWGTANAKTVTLSFQVYSSLTGTFGGALLNSATDRSYPFTYTVSSANTWTQINITISGDTSGTWLTTNGVGIIVNFGLGVGSSLSGTAGAWTGSGLFSATGATSVVGTNGATFYITGVQLEKGSTATSFDYRPYGTELALCQRYCVVGNNLNDGGNYHLGTGSQYTSTNSLGVFNYPVKMRAAPSLSVSSASHFSLQVGSTSAACTTVGVNNACSQNMSWYVITGTSFTVGQSGWVYGNTNAATATFSAEL